MGLGGALAIDHIIMFNGLDPDALPILAKVMTGTNEQAAKEMRKERLKLTRNNIASEGWYEEELNAYDKLLNDKIISTDEHNLQSRDTPPKEVQ